MEKGRNAGTTTPHSLLKLVRGQHPTNLVRFHFRTFEYICDLYSELEATGEVPYDQRMEDRVVAVIGLSARAEERRDVSRSRGWVGPTEELLGTERDKGHFMAHFIGGGLDVNVFSQERRLNRGWSLQGKLPSDGELLLSATGNLVLLTSDLRGRLKRSSLAGIRATEDRWHSVG